MAESTKKKSPRVSLRDLPAWLAVAVAVSGILLTYHETRIANEREVVFRIWDDAWLLFNDSLDFPGNSSPTQVQLEMGRLQSIHAHAELLNDRSLKEAAFEVSRVWSAAHLEPTDNRFELAEEIETLLDLAANVLGTSWVVLDRPTQSTTNEVGTATGANFDGERGVSTGE